MGKNDLHNVVSQHSIKILEKDSRIRAIIDLNVEEMSKKDLAMKELSKKLQADKKVSNLVSFHFYFIFVTKII